MGHLLRGGACPRQDATRTPRLDFPKVDTDVCMPSELLLKDGEHWTRAIWRRGKV